MHRHPGQCRLASDNVDGLLSLAVNAGSMSEQQRKSALQGCDKRLAEQPRAGWVQLQLAVLLSQQPSPTPADLSRARDLFAAYLRDTAHKPRNAQDFARMQLSRIDTLQRWQRALRDEVRARHDLEQKLEALKAIELRMNQSEGVRKVPLERQ